MNYRRRLIIEIYVIFFILLVLQMTSVIAVTMTNREKEVHETNLSLVIAIRESLDQNIENLRKEMALLSYTDEVQSLESDRMDLILKKAVEITPAISQIYVMDRTGKQFYKTSHLETLGNRNDREYFQQAIKGNHYISDVIRSRSTGEMISTIAVPIEDSKGIKGVLGASLDFKQIDEMINELSLIEHSYIYIVDSSGKVILHPNESYIDELLDLSYLEPIKSVMAGNTGTSEYFFDGSQKFVAYSSLNETGWGIMIAISSKNAFLEVRVLIIWFIGILILFSIVLMIWSVVASKRMAVPILNITNALNDISKKNYSIAFDQSRTGELGSIQTSILFLAEEMKKSHQDLENNVKARTDELLEIQEKLIVSEKISGINRFMTRLSHEINTPLGVCITDITHLEYKYNQVNELYESNKLSKKKLSEFFHVLKMTTLHINHELEAIDVMLKTFKDVTFINTSLPKQRVNVSQEISDAISENSSINICDNHHFDIICDDELYFEGVQQVLSKVLQYLLRNSFKHGCPIEGTMHIKISVKEVNDKIEINYSDNGNGMPEEYQAMVFEPLFKGKMGDDGQGLGLSIVYALVNNQLNGKIEYIPSNNETIFLISFPKLSNPQEI